MKILIISPNVGRTAPGIVFERLIFGLSSIHDIDLLTSDFEPSIDLNFVRKVILLPKPKIHPRITNLSVFLFKKNIFDTLWAYKAFSKTSNSKYDLVFSFMSFGHFSALIAGVFFSKKYNIKLAVYAVDAVPAPVGWMVKDYFYENLKKLMAQYLSKCDALFSSNQQMLDYQLTTFTHKENLVTAVLFNPSLGSFQNDNVGLNDENIFLYTGGIYGPRKVTYLLSAFELLLKSYPLSKLQFVGSVLSKEILSTYNTETISKIEIIPFTKNLKPFYETATALIDIDADIDNDVFLSSKMTNYILINKPIICQTGENSPSRMLFKNINSILQCGHNSHQIYKAMSHIITKKNQIDYTDRKYVKQQFELQTIVAKLNMSLQKLTENEI